MPSSRLLTFAVQEKHGIFSCNNRTCNMEQTSETRILNRIRGTGSGWSFSPRDFLDLGERATIDSALHRLAHKGQVRRVIRLKSQACSGGACCCANGTGQAPIAERAPR